MRCCTRRMSTSPSEGLAAKVAGRVYEDWNDYFRNAPRVSDDFVVAMSGARRDLMPLEDRESLDLADNHRWKTP